MLNEIRNALCEAWPAHFQATAAQVGAEVVGTKATGAVLEVTLRVPPSFLASQAAVMRSDGRTHEEVTAELDRATGGRFREVLVEVVNESGDRMWCEKPHTISLNLSLD